MGLADALNTRASGTVDEAHVYTPPSNDPLPPDAVFPERSTAKMAPYYSDEQFVKALERMCKAAPFMLGNLYAAEGIEQLPRFIELAESVHSMAVLHRVSGILNAE